MGIAFTAHARTAVAGCGVALAVATVFALQRSAEHAAEAAFGQLQRQLALHGAARVGATIERIDAVVAYAAALHEHALAPDAIVAAGSPLSGAAADAWLFITNDDDEVVFADPATPARLREILYAHAHLIAAEGQHCTMCLERVGVLLRTLPIPDTTLSVGAVVDLAHLYDATLAGVRSGAHGYAWMISSDGVVLGAPGPTRPGTVLTAADQDATFGDALARILSGGAGQAEYQWSDADGSRRRIAAWAPIDLPGIAAAVVLSADRTELSLMGRQSRQLATLVSIAGLLIVSGALLWFAVDERRRRRDLQASTSALVHAERLATIGVLAAGIVHELRNPLSYLKMNLELLRGDAPDRTLGDAETQSMLSDCQTGADHIHKIVDDLRRLSRRDTSGEAELFDLRDALSDAAMLASSALNGQARLSVNAGDEAPVRMDRARVTQVLLNLLVNAAQAAASTREATTPQVIARVWVEADRVCAEVEDSGPGVQPEDLGKIFEAFYSTKSADEGTGLGLSVSRSIVEANAGSLAAASHGEQLGGAVFRMELPLAPGSTGPGAGELEPEAASA